MGVVCALTVFESWPVAVPFVCPVWPFVKKLIVSADCLQD